ncbi:MAG TPA: hypothetical protein VGI74_08480 [Streptosporangiaceae bacterium]|jgi:hypothetical protein
MTGATGPDQVHPGSAVTAVGLVVLAVVLPGHGRSPGFRLHGQGGR